MTPLTADEKSLPMPLDVWVLERFENCIRIAGEKSGADRDGWLEDADFFRAILRRLQPVETSVALTKCPYCERPADSEGGINHLGGCIGLEKIDLNRLQYNALVSRAFTPETTEHHRLEVMNPPQSAAEGCEARNLNTANVMGLGQVHRATEARPAEVAPLPSFGDPCPCCASGKIGQSGYNFRCANCGWLGPRVPWSPQKAGEKHGE